MPQRFLFQHDVRDLIFKITGVGEKQRSVKPEHGNVLALFQSMVGCASQRVSRIPAQKSHLGSHAFVQKHHERKYNTDHDAPVQVGREDKGADESNNRNGAVIPLGFPRMDKPRNVDQSDHGHHDDGGQNGLGQMVKQRREKKQGDHHRQAGKHAGQTGYGAALEVHCGS